MLISKKRASSILVVMLAASVGVLGVSAPASAATPKCNVVQEGVASYNSGVWADRPFYGTPSYQTASCVLYQGVVDNSVASLQTTLNGCYGGSLAVDGVFGPATKAAVKVMQAALGVTQDGVAGPITLSKMFVYTTSGQCLQQPIMNWGPWG